jgi:hypothetical protein
MELDMDTIRCEALKRELESHPGPQIVSRGVITLTDRFVSPRVPLDVRKSLPGR